MTAMPQSHQENDENYAQNDIDAVIDDIDKINVEETARHCIGWIFLTVGGLIAVVLVVLAFCDGVFSDSRFLLNVDGNLDVEGHNNISDNLLYLVIADIARKAVRAGLIFATSLVFLGIGKRALMPSIVWNKGAESNTTAEEANKIEWASRGGKFKRDSRPMTWNDLESLRIPIVEDE